MSAPFPDPEIRRREAVSAARPGISAPARGAGADTRLLDLADQCVMCGLCLPHCPTYRVGRDEAESPRGRIAIARALTDGRIGPEPTALAHLDQCLTCLSCEDVCPSRVHYGEIITGIRAALRRRRPRAGWLVRTLRDPARMVLLARAGALLRAGRWLPAIARALPLPAGLRTATERWPDAPARPARIPAKPSATSRGRVIVFRGCVASVFDRDTHAAAARLLEALGYDVVIPQGTPCCGALARHAGEIESADRDAAAARAALLATGAATVLVSATGCFGDLADHVGGEGLEVRDIHAFLAGDERISALRFRPLTKRAALHLPCTQINVVGQTNTIRALLTRIPALTVLDLPLQPKCCGAAGSYFIEHAGIADRLRDEKLEQAAAQSPDVLLTTNVGCRMHLANGLRGKTPRPEVLHPLALLARQLENGGP